MQQRVYNAKLLLFGEYTIIHGSQALALPLTHYSAKWTHRPIKEQDPIKRKYLLGLANYLKVQVEGFNFDIDGSAFLEDLQNDLYFESNIPIGYGVGSSGALTAGVYDRYGKGVINPQLSVLKNNLAKIENFFHGSSSGIDPLICYLDQIILLESKGCLLYTSPSPRD